MSGQFRATTTPKDPVSGQLRVMATTDLHMQMLGYDYFADQPNDKIGLINLADTITKLRASPEIATVLCDNGDLIQGNLLADHIADLADTHPMIAALNMLGYDAMNLGNHEFDFGLDFLRKVLGDADFPTLSANIHFPQGPAPFAIIGREVVCSDGKTRPLQIGITGFAPPQIADWQQDSQAGPITSDDILDAARRVVPQLKSAGADLIIALCHSGIGSETPSDRMENAAVPLAAIAGIDVIVAGHTHQHFPNPAHPPSDAIDPERGTLHGKPTVLAASHGQALGVIDLDLAWSQEGWTVADHHARLVMPTTQTDSPIREKLHALVAEAHEQTLQNMRKPITQTPVRIHSYLATIAPDQCQQILAKAAQTAVRAALSDGPHADLPVLAATSPFRFGGQSALGRFIDIPPGPVTRYDVAAIFPFADLLYGVQRSGAQVLNWLERSASYYHQLQQGVSDQDLINLLAPSYHCDTLFGLAYEIDLSGPARFDPYGQVINPDARRIKSLRYAGRAVQHDDTFIIATNSYRAEGGGRFAKPLPHDIILRGPHKMRDVLTTALQTGDVIGGPVAPTWTFTPIPQTCANFVSSARAAAYLPDHITKRADLADGLAQYQIRF